MGERFPNCPPPDGDDPSQSPSTNQRSLLATDAAGNTRRILVDVDRNLLVNDQGKVNALASGSVVGVLTGVLTTIVTHTAPSAQTVSKISCSGTNYAKFQLVLNTVTIETLRSGPTRNIVFQFDNPLALAASDILDVKVTFFKVGQTNDFEATIYGA